MLCSVLWDKLTFSIPKRQYYDKGLVARNYIVAVAKGHKYYG
jgi:hypothetical protein